VKFVIGAIAGVISAAISLDAILTWLTIWPLFWLSELIRDRRIGHTSVVLGYYFLVLVRVVFGLSLALILDRIRHDRVGDDHAYWFAWLGNYLTGLIVETISGLSLQKGTKAE
jgi:hypothetical protein